MKFEYCAGFADVMNDRKQFHTRIVQHSLGAAERIPQFVRSDPRALVSNENSPRTAGEDSATDRIDPRGVRSPAGFGNSPAPGSLGGTVRSNVKRAALAPVEHVRSEATLRVRSRNRTVDHRGRRYHRVRQRSMRYHARSP